MSRRRRRNDTFIIGNKITANKWFYKFNQSLGHHIKSSAIKRAARDGI